MTSTSWERVTEAVDMYSLLSQIPIQKVFTDQRLNHRHVHVH